VTPSVELRPAAAADQEFRFRVYAGTRADELAVVAWDAAARRAFLRQQFDAREAWYRDQFGGATVDIVTVDGEPAGVLCVDRGAEIRIVEIALVPERRGRGAGTSLLRAVLAEADAAGKRVTVHVEALNPARRLYDRLGFTVADDKGVYVLLERLPSDLSR
jgi:ribosomal protein S18 acetylase RimI-like enzyme